MHRAVIAIADAAHARLYTYEHADNEAPRFREERDLVSAGRQAHGGFADSQDRAGDHRERYLATLESRFAKAIVAELDRLTRERAYTRVIVVAAPRMLGALREEYRPLQRPELELVEVGQDLAWLSSPQLHDQLAAMRLIAPRERVALARGPRPR